MYEIGDYVVKAGNGVCRVENIFHPDLPGVDTDRLYYLLIPVESSHSKLYIPVDAPAATMRKALDEQSAWDVIRGVSEIEAAWIANDKLREQAYREAIHSCDPTALISIIKNLYLRRRQRSEQGKKSTATDERYFKLAEDTLYGELAFALCRDKSEIRQLIIDTIHQKQLRCDR